MICLLAIFISLNSTAPMNRPINMPPQKSDTYLLASTFRHAGDAGLPQKADDGAADGNLAADIHENGDDPEYDMRVFQRAGALFGLAFTDVRQLDAEKDERDDDEDDAEREVRDLDRIRAVDIRFIEQLKDKIAAHQRSDCGADGIESLGQVQPAGCRAFRPEDGHIGIGGDLQHGKANAHDETSRPGTNYTNADWPPG